MGNGAGCCGNNPQVFEPQTKREVKTSRFSQPKSSKVFQESELSQKNFDPLSIEQVHPSIQNQRLGQLQQFYSSCLRQETNEQLIPRNPLPQQITTSSHLLQVGQTIFESDPKTKQEVIQSISDGSIQNIPDVCQKNSVAKSYIVDKSTVYPCLPHDINKTVK